MLLVLIVVGGVAWYAYRSTQNIPEFYQSALTTPPDLLDQQGQEFESRIFDLQHESHDRGEWQAVFTEGQVNGWLATDLPEKFPDAIPPQIAHPRIRIMDDELEIAFVAVPGDLTASLSPREMRFARSTQTKSRSGSKRPKRVSCHCPSVRGSKQSLKHYGRLARKPRGLKSKVIPRRLSCCPEP